MSGSIRKDLRTRHASQRSRSRNTAFCGRSHPDHIRCRWTVWVIKHPAISVWYHWTQSGRRSRTARRRSTTRARRSSAYRPHIIVITSSPACRDGKSTKELKDALLLSQPLPANRPGENSHFRNLTNGSANDSSPALGPGLHLNPPPGH
jgi:hypothetical protein